MSAWASPQSRPIAATDLDARLADVEARFTGADPPLPPFWGGHLVRVDELELWQGRKGSIARSGCLPPVRRDVRGRTSRTLTWELAPTGQADEHVFVSGPVGEATILHADLDAFYASVEQRDNRRLRGRPVIVGGGVVLAASYEAKACGVRTAMGGRDAKRLCPAAIVVSPRMSAYSDASKAVFEVFEDTTPLVEGLSIDEAFLDVGGLLRAVPGTPHPRSRRGCGATCRNASGSSSPSVSACTEVPRKGREVKIAKPNGLLVVPPDREARLLAPASRLGRLWGVGPEPRGQARRARDHHRRRGRVLW